MWGQTSSGRLISLENLSSIGKESPEKSFQKGRKKNTKVFKDAHFEVEKMITKQVKQKQFSKTKVAKISKNNFKRKKKKQKSKVLSLQTNRFQIFEDKNKKNKKNNNFLKLSELPHFSFLSQNPKEDLKKNNREEKEQTKKEEDQKGKEDVSKKKEIPSSEVLLESLLVFDTFSRNEEKCEIWTLKSVCVNSSQVVSSDSTQNAIRRVKHLMKSKQQAKFKLEKIPKKEDFDSKDRLTFLKVDFESDLLFDSSREKHLVEHNCVSDLAADSKWDQSLLVTPFSNFIEVLPSSKNDQTPFRPFPAHPSAFLFSSKSTRRE